MMERTACLNSGRKLLVKFVTLKKNTTNFSYDVAVVMVDLFIFLACSYFIKKNIFRLKIGNCGQGGIPS